MRTPTVGLVLPRGSSGTGRGCARRRPARRRSSSKPHEDLLDALRVTAVEHAPGAVALAGLGEWTYQGTLPWVETDEGWGIAWHARILHPELDEAQSLQRTRTWPERAALLDHTRTPITEQRPTVEVGISGGASRRTRRGRGRARRPHRGDRGDGRARTRPGRGPPGVVHASFQSRTADPVAGDVGVAEVAGVSGDLALAVVVEEGGSGGAVAAPLVARFLQALD